MKKAADRLEPAQDLVPSINTILPVIDVQLA